MKGFAVALCLSLTFTAQGEIKASERPSERWDPNIGADPALITLYFSLTDLPTADQRDQMWALPNATKAALWTYNIKRYLRDHPELSTEAQETLREGIRLIATPAWFDIAPGSFGYEPQSNALADFKKRTISTLSRETIGDVFIRLGSEPASAGANPAEPESSRAAKALAPRADVMHACYCASSFECGSSSSYGCYDSWCEPTRHCGWFGWEMCVGTCKSN